MALLHRSVTSYLPDGYTFRGATFYDAAEILYLFNQRQINGSAACHVEQIRQEWQATQFNPAMDVRLIFDPREHLIGYIEVWLQDVQPWLWGCVHPDYEGRGVGTTLLCWAEARVRLAMDMLPNQQQLVPRFGAPHALENAQALCEHLGWQRAERQNPAARQAHKTTGALRLLNVDEYSSTYDIYEKDMRKADVNFS